MNISVVRVIQLVSTMKCSKQVEFTISVKMKFFDQKSYKKILVLYVEPNRYYIQKGELWELVTLNKLDILLDQVIKGMAIVEKVNPDWDIHISAIPVKCYEIKTRANGTKIVYE